MSTKFALFSVALLMTALVVSGCGIIAGSAQAQARSEPTEVVNSFYSWYLASMQFDPEAGERKLPTEAEIEARPELSNELLSRRLEVLASFGDVGGYDPLICAQDVPTDFQSELLELSEEEALVRVTTSFEGHSFSVRLVPAENWQMAQVICKLN